MLSASDISQRANEFLATLPGPVRADVEGKIQELRWHESAGCLSPDMYLGKRVLDWEAGLGGFSGAFYCLGAGEVVAIDSWVEPGSVAYEIRNAPGISFSRMSIQDFIRDPANGPASFDLLFSNTVTEHISDLPGAFTALHSVLKPGGHYLNIHDNYYSPCGSHDHGFWFYGDAGAVTHQGVECWSQPEKCTASAQHRARLLTNMPWTWNDRLERLRDPNACRTCPYYMRSQPWGHLTSVDDFSRVFDDPSFMTLRPGSSLNKLTTFQVRQICQEAGFRLVRFHRNRCTNQPAGPVLELGISELELTTTTTVWLLAR
ncbi:methyltransferase domain-containing protein [Novosphingobium sp.]|uniref:class I SAM-dependent methyltransferase n=1 Tax=Novosphingobium sp. TaxID=1874826 RepID=UPI002612243F|nr:methyltransferase domain-containing protein [Novosphingobium sp.]